MKTLCTPHHTRITQLYFPYSIKKAEVHGVNYEIPDEGNIMTYQ